MPTRSAPTCNLSAASKAALTSCSLRTSSNSAVRPSVRAVARVSSHRDDIDLIRVHRASLSRAASTRIEPSAGYRSKIVRVSRDGAYFALLALIPEVSTRLDIINRLVDHQSTG